MEEKITISDIRKAGHCVSGARRWFALRGFNFRDVLAHGIEAETLLATNDQLALDVVNHKRKRDTDHG